MERIFENYNLNTKINSFLFKILFMKTEITFIYDGECPFCNHFAELLELKSKIKNITILDARKNQSKTITRC